MASDVIGQRLKALREADGRSQDEIATAFGFKDRQTLSAIETGVRRLSADELLRAAEIFGVDLDVLADPFLLVGEGRFSWRQNGTVGQALRGYELDAGRFIAALRAFMPGGSHRSPLLRQELRLSKKSSYEDASAVGEAIGSALELGSVPADRLAEAMEHKLDIHVLMVDPIPGISGAACRLPDLDVVLINRSEVPGRRNFDLAHEMFHILTWEAMPPEHIEDVTPDRKSRVEQLADNFAAAVLMPRAVVDRSGGWSGLAGDDLVGALNRAADELHVTASALGWRLVGLGAVDKATMRSTDGARLTFNGGRRPVPSAMPPLFSRSFIEALGRAIDEGRLSVRRAAGLLKMTIDDLAILFASHKLDVPFEL